MAGRAVGAMLICAWMIFAACDSRAQTLNPPAKAKHVLMIFSETRDLPGNAMMEHGVKEELLKESTGPVEFFTENLDARRFPDPKYDQLFKDYLKDKYRQQNLDLAIMFVSRDFQLARQLPAAFRTNLPVIYVVVNDLNDPNPTNDTSFTGIFQRFDIQGTLKFIFNLQPETRRVVVVGGVSASDQAMLGKIVETSRSMDGVDFEFWTNRPMPEVYQAAKSLPAGTVLLLSTVQSDVTGTKYLTTDIANTLAPSASVPVYVMGASLIGSGTLGGNVIDFNELGIEAARLAMRSLNGTPVGDIPIELQSNGVPMADWRALRRWNLKRSRLPGDSVILYQPRSLWEDHKTFIILIAAGLLAQAITIIALLLQRRQSRLAEVEIQRQRTELAHVARVSTMGQLASALTHELNQPLGAILRNTEAAEIFLQSAEPNLKEIRAILADIRKDDQRAGAVIDKMSTLLKRRKLVSERLDLRELAEDTVTLARSDAGDRGVKLVLEMPAHLPSALGDRVHLQQVLLNLIFNGMDAMLTTPRDQRLIVVKVGKTNDGKLQVGVSDRGVGITPDSAAHIFEPFFTTKPNGMGMGLAISGTIIEAHGGTIWAEGNPPGGTTFIFTLPQFEEKDAGDLPAVS
jgi:signal transduction histidine kinase